MAEHSDLPVGAETAHPPGYVQNTDPGAVGAFKPWWQTDNDATPTAILGFFIRNADNSAWLDALGVVIGAVASVFGRTGAVVAAEGDYSLDQLSGVTIATPGAGEYLRHNGTAFVNSTIDSGDLGSGGADATKFLRGDRTWQLLSSLSVALSDGTYGEVDVSGSGTSFALNTTVISTYGRTLALAANASAARTLLGAIIGTDVQAFHANLAAFAGLSLIADRLPYANGSGTLALATFTAFGRTLAALADAAAGRTALALVPGTDVQAYNANLAAFAGLTLIADRLPYANGSGTLALATLTSFIRTLLDDTDAAAARTTLGVDASGKQPQTFTFALSDETTAITTGTNKLKWRAPFPFTLTGVRAGLSTTSSSGDPTVDINKNGTTVLSTKLSIDAGEVTSVTAASAAVISVSSFSDDDELEMDIDTAGTGAKGLKVTIYVTPT